MSFGFGGGGFGFVGGRGGSSGPPVTGGLRHIYVNGAQLDGSNQYFNALLNPITSFMLFFNGGAGFLINDPDDSSDAAVYQWQYVTNGSGNKGFKITMPGSYNIAENNFFILY